MIDRYLEPFLGSVSTQAATLIAMLPDGRGSIFRVRAPQNANHPFIIISPPFDFDNGNTSQGTVTKKIEDFVVCVCGNTSADVIDPIADLVKSMLESIRQQYVPGPDATPKIWCQCLLVESMRFNNGQSLDGNEQGVPCWVISCKAGYDE